MKIYYYLTRIQHRLTNYFAKHKHEDVQQLARELLKKTNFEQKRNVLFICTGNICRSAYAHHALVKVLAERGIKNVKVKSAGVATTPGKRADKVAKKVALARGVDLSNHLTSFIYRDGLNEAALIVVMEPAHARGVTSVAPTARNKIVYGGHLADSDGAAIVADPYGHGEEVFEKCFDILDKIVDKIADGLEDS